MTDEHKNNIRKAMLGRHFTMSEQGKKNISNAQKGLRKGSMNHKWVGDNVSYSALHSWVRRTLGTPSKCEKCLTTVAKRYEWANISGEYRRDIKDWIRLCASCHRQMDNNTAKGWLTRKGAQ